LRRFDGAVEGRHKSGAADRRIGEEFADAALSRYKGDRLPGPGQRGLRGGRMYSVVYWAGMTMLLLWTAYSAYSAIIGL